MILVANASSFRVLGNGRFGPETILNVDCVDVNATVVFPELDVQILGANRESWVSDDISLETHYHDPLLVDSIDDDFVWTCWDLEYESNCSPLLDDVSRIASTLVIAGGTFPVGMFEFEVTYFKGNRRATSSVTVGFRDNEPPDVRISRVPSPTDEIVYFEAIVQFQGLQYYHSGDFGGVRVEMCWSIDSDAGDSRLLTNSYLNDMYMFSLNPMRLVAGEEYNVSFVAMVNGNSALASTVYRRQGFPPIVGMCDVTLPDGLAFDTKFEISCFGFADPLDGQLNYEFRQMLHEDGSGSDFGSFVTWSNSPSPFVRHEVSITGILDGESVPVEILVVVSNSFASVNTSVWLYVSKNIYDSVSVADKMDFFLSQSQLAPTVAGCFSHLVYAEVYLKELQDHCSYYGVSLPIDEYQASVLTARESCANQFDGFVVTPEIFNQAVILGSSQMQLCGDGTESGQQAVDDALGVFVFFQDVCSTGEMTRDQVSSALYLIEEGTDVLNSMLTQKMARQLGLTGQTGKLLREFTSLLGGLMNRVGFKTVSNAEEFRENLETVEIGIYQTLGPLADRFPPLALTARLDEAWKSGEYAPGYSLRRASSVKTYTVTLIVPPGLTDGVLGVQLAYHAIPPLVVSSEVIAGSLFYRLTDGDGEILESALGLEVTIQWKGPFPNDNFACRVYDEESEDWVLDGNVNANDNVVNCSHVRSNGYFPVGFAPPGAWGMEEWAIATTVILTLLFMACLIGTSAVSVVLFVRWRRKIRRVVPSEDSKIVIRGNAVDDARVREEEFQEMRKEEIGCSKEAEEEDIPDQEIHERVRTKSEVESEFDSRYELVECTVPNQSVSTADHVLGMVDTHHQKSPIPEPPEEIILRSAEETRSSHDSPSPEFKGKASFVCLANEPDSLESVPLPEDVNSELRDSVVFELEAEAADGSTWEERGGGGEIEMGEETIIDSIIRQAVGKDSLFGAFTVFDVDEDGDI